MCIRDSDGSPWLRWCDGDDVVRSAFAVGVIDGEETGDQRMFQDDVFPRLQHLEEFFGLLLGGLRYGDAQRAVDEFSRLFELIIEHFLARSNCALACDGSPDHDVSPDGI